MKSWLKLSSLAKQIKIIETQYLSQKLFSYQLLNRPQLYLFINAISN